MNTPSRSIRLAALAAAVLALSACAPAAPAPESAQAEVTIAADSVTMADTWVKAMPEGMSAAFGVIENPSAVDVTIVSATTEVAHMVELHETVEDETGQHVMREKQGGFVIPAGERLALEPGGNHLMLMGLTGPLVAGEDVTLTLTFSDGSTLDITAPVKDYAGANENYEGGHGGSDEDAGHDHGGDH